MSNVILKDFFLCVVGFSQYYQLYYFDLENLGRYVFYKTFIKSFIYDLLKKRFQKLPTMELQKLVIIGSQTFEKSYSSQSIKIANINKRK